MEAQDRDYNWLTEHPTEMHRLYAGQWLAVLDGRVVAAGKDGPTVYEEARRQHPDGRIVIHVVDHEIANPVYECLPLG